MKKLVFALFLLSFFACKKEESKVVQVQSIDSTIYYNKWTKVTKTNFSNIGFNDIEVLANKKVALIGFSDVTIIDSNYSFWRSAKYFSNTYNSFKLSLDSKNASVRNCFYYFSALTSPNVVPYNQIFVSNEIRDNEVQTDLYDRNYFINDTTKNNVYYVRSQDYDYFFYYVYKPSEKNYNYLFNYFDHNRSIYKTIEFKSVNEISKVFKSGNKIFFQSKYGNLFKVIDIVTFNLMDGSYSTDFGFIGAHNGVIYLNNKDKGIYKTTDFVNYTKVFQDNLLGQNITYFSGKHLLYYKYDYLKSTIIDELILFDLKTNKAITIEWKDPDFDSIQYYWVIDNTLYVLTTNNIYARKF
ncbi:MAG: hypothetical protein ACOYMA_04830 [Bacteroidia bacterium]